MDTAESHIERILQHATKARTAKVNVPMEFMRGKRGVINQLRISGLFVSVPYASNSEVGIPWIYVTSYQEEADRLISEERISFGTKYPDRKK